MQNKGQERVKDYKNNGSQKREHPKVLTLKFDF
jgi:hypothetical protein